MQTGKQPTMKSIKRHYFTLFAICAAALGSGCAQPQLSAGDAAAGTSLNLAAIPSAFHGAWTSNQSGTNFADDDGHLFVEAHRLFGWEWRGDVVSVKTVGPQTVIIKSRGLAEGTRIETELTLQLSGGGSVLLARHDDSSSWRALYRARDGDRSQVAYQF